MWGDLLLNFRTIKSQGELFQQNFSRFAAEASLAVSIEVMGLWSAEDDAWSGGDIFEKFLKEG